MESWVAAAMALDRLLTVFVFPPYHQRESQLTTSKTCFWLLWIELLLIKSLRWFFFKKLQYTYTLVRCLTVASESLIWKPILEVQQDLEILNFLPAIDAIMSEIEVIVETLKKLEEKFDSVRKEIKKERDDSRKERNEIRNEIKGMRDELSERFNTIDSKISDLAVRVSHNEKNLAELRTNIKSESAVKRDSVNAHYDLHVLLVNGISWKQQEDLQSIYADLSRKLGFEKPPPARLSRFNTSSKADFERDRRPIKILFSSLADREQFMANYKAIGKSLLISCISGCENLSTRIYIQESLDSATYQLKTAALRLRKSGKLAVVSIINLQVYVRVKNDSPPVWIDSMDTLKKIACRKWT